MKTTPPKCKEWLVGIAGKFTKPFDWQQIRQWYALGFIPANALAKPSDTSESEQMISTITFFTSNTAALRKLVGNYASGAVSTEYPVSTTQKEIIKSLDWPFDYALLKNYYGADKLIQNLGWRNSNGYSSYADSESPWYWSLPPTEAQENFLNKYNVQRDKYLTKDAASDLIEKLREELRKNGVIHNNYITQRQWMVLRFWGKIPEKHWGINEVSNWLDAWYCENPGRLTAWEQFKKDAGDDGSFTDQNRVPFGIGEEYLKKVTK